MNLWQADKIVNHYKQFFGKNSDPEMYFADGQDEGDFGVIVLHFLPSDTFPYQVLATVGASEYKMPEKQSSAVSQRLEFMMFLDKDFDISKKENNWVVDFLLSVAYYPYESKASVSLWHTLDMFPEQDKISDENHMTCGYIMLPHAVEDQGRKTILHLKKGLFGKITFLQVMPINRLELDEHMKNEHPYMLEEKFYPDSEKPHVERAANTNFLTRAKR